VGEKLATTDATNQHGHQSRHKMGVAMVFSWSLHGQLVAVPIKGGAINE
jgi:hypothetical protein